MRTIILCFLIVLSSCSSQNTFIRPKRANLELSIKLDKKTYLKGEPILMDVELTNNGNAFKKITSKNMLTLYTGHSLSAYLVSKDGETFPINSCLLYTSDAADE